MRGNPKREIGRVAVPATCVSVAILLAFAMVPSRVAGDTLSTGTFTFTFDGGYLPVARSLISAAAAVADDVGGFLSVNVVNVSVRIYERADFRSGFPPFGAWASARGGNISVGLPPLPSVLSYGWTPERLESVAAHELTHILLPIAFPNATTGIPGGFPAWLEEGLGNYLGARYDGTIDATARGIMRYLLDTSNLSTIDDMFLPVPFVTTQGYSLVQYLTHVNPVEFHAFLDRLRGFSSCCDYSQVDQALAQAYGNDSTQLTTRWHAYLVDEYTKDYRYPDLAFPRLPLPGGTKVPSSWVGNLIAFTQETSQGTRACVSHADGTGLRCAPGNATITADPKLSPDADRVLLTSNAAGHYDLGLWNLTDDSIVLLTNDSHVDVAGSWSPDGRAVLFSSTRAGTFDVWKLTLADRSLEALIQSPSDEFSPAYSPDGRSIAFVSNRSGPYRVFVSDASGGAIRPLWEGGPYQLFPSWAPDGSKVAASVDGAGFTGIAEVNVTSLARQVLVNLTTGPDRSGTGCAAGFPVFSPNGTQIAFATLPDIRIASAVPVPPAEGNLVLPIGIALLVIAVVIGVAALAIRRRRRKPDSGEDT